MNLWLHLSSHSQEGLLNELPITTALMNCICSFAIEVIIILKLTTHAKNTNYTKSTGTNYPRFYNLLNRGHTCQKGIPKAEHLCSIQSQFQFDEFKVSWERHENAILTVRVEMTLLRYCYYYTEWPNLFAWSYCAYKKGFWVQIP
jgi:hypothetical protein